MRIVNSHTAFDYLRRIMRQDIEEFWVIGLKPNKSIIGLDCIFRGTVDACLIHPRDIFRFAYKKNASSLILAHNHPSQDPSPSEHDFKITRQLHKASLILQIPLLDHLIITEKSYVSFADKGYLRALNP